MKVTSDTPPINQPSSRFQEAAKLLEISFLEEMLKYSGIGKSPGDFGGGVGEDQFSGLLLRSYAETIVQGGGLGIQESIVRALSSR